MAEETNQWEYRVMSVGSFWTGVKDEKLQAMLDEWGAEGWEVVGFRTLENTNKATLIAKRPLTAFERRQRSWPG